MGYREQTDDKLIARCINGDRHALDELVWRYREIIFAFAYPVTRDHDDA
jgi:DNA-directed RNA polymerase specialized sigma24 family protein